MIYNKIMSPIELLSHSYRIPIIHSSIYEPGLIVEIIIPSNKTAEYLENLNKGIKNTISFNPFEPETQDLYLFQLTQLVSAPLNVCQFHVIEVK